MTAFVGSSQTRIATAEEASSSAHTRVLKLQVCSQVFIPVRQVTLLGKIRTLLSQCIGGDDDRSVSVFCAHALSANASDANPWEVTHVFIFAC